MSNDTQILEDFTNQEYKYGFSTNIESDTFPPGLHEDVIRAISKKKDEPAFLLEWRLKAYQKWLTMKEPTWAFVEYPSIDFNSISYYSSPKKKVLNSLDEVDPEILATYEKLGIPLIEQQRLAGVAVDAVFDSVSIVTNF